MAAELTAEKLNAWYDEAERLDKESFAEFRTNVLLIAGEHYQKRGGKGASGHRTTVAEAHENQKLRLVKNRCHRVARRYRRAILAHAPGTTVKPQIDTQIQDRKSADLNLAVWRDAKYKYRIREKVREWCHHFVDVGEVAMKLRFNPDEGNLKGYEAMVGDDGQPIVDPATGEPVADTNKPVFKGKFEWETVFAANLFRAPHAKSMRTSPWLGIRTMTDLELLKDNYAGQPDKLKLLDEGANEEDFIVFDHERGKYNRETKQILVKEFYFRPCKKYREGWFVIMTKSGILEQGPLPFGIFPIVWAGFDEHPTAVRAKSILRVVRPYQAELNRASSQQAMTQITVGDDKIIYQAGTKLANGTLLPGIRGVTFQGAPPQILPGRDGGQFTPYIQNTSAEMDDAVELLDPSEKDPQGQLDAYSMLYRGINRQSLYGEYAEKFEQFLIDATELYLELARKYMDDEELIYAVGPHERVNIAEFRGTTPLCYSVKIEAQSETVEEKLGRQLTMNHVLQYVGNRLERDDIGKVMRQMPYGNKDGAFDDFTIDHDNAENDMLALERGQQPAISEYENHEYICKRLVKRMKEADFEFLPDEIKQNYSDKYAAHRKFLEEQAAALAAAKNEFIPVGGAMIAADMYIPNAENPDAAPKRVRIPYQALDWLVTQLEKQNMSLDKMEDMNKGMVAEMARQVLGNQGGNQMQRGNVA